MFGIKRPTGDRVKVAGASPGYDPWHKGMVRPAASHPGLKISKKVHVGSGRAKPTQR